MMRLSSRHMVPIFVVALGVATLMGSCPMDDSSLSGCGPVLLQALPELSVIQPLSNVTDSHVLILSQAYSRPPDRPPWASS